MRYPSEMREENERKLLKECAYTRNKHIEIEQRYEKLVSRKSLKIDLLALESVLRKKEDNNKAAAEESAGKNPPAEKADKKETEFKEIINIHTDIIHRKAKNNRDDFYENILKKDDLQDKSLYPEYNEPVLMKEMPEIISEEVPEEEVCFDEGAASDDEIEVVEVDKIILPEEGVGRVFAVPFENKEAKQSAPKESVKKNIGTVVLAAAVLIGGVFLICYIWPI